MLAISIVPRLPPAIDGVGDYALTLARQLRLGLGIEMHVIVGDRAWAGATEIEGFPIDKVELRSAATLLSLLLSCCQNSTIVLLHYVGHGYAKKGCPSWLIKGLEHWKKNVANVPLLTMFHELYAVGPRWTSDFWLSPLQKDLAARLARLSDRCVTNRQGSAKALYELSRGKHTQITTLPVLSNMGETETVRPLSERERRLVVVGQGKSKLRVYRESLPELSRACEVLEIEEIWDIGPSTGLDLSSVIKMPIVELGQKSVPEISDILSKSCAGFLNYNVEHLAKSGIFAAYCAHGLLPISYRSSTLPVDGIEARIHYWIPDSQGIILNSVEELQAIADNAPTWYQTHSLSVQANTFATCIADISIGCSNSAYAQGR